MKVLHDYDQPALSGRYALRRGLDLILYAAAKPLGAHCPIHHETDRHLETLIKLDHLCGVEPIIGIRHHVYNGKPQARDTCRLYGVDTRRHWHIGEDDDPDRRREWDPPLAQSRNTWHYEERWIAGDPPALRRGELPVWHVDHPHRLPDYIDFLYSWKVLGASPYAE